MKIYLLSALLILACFFTCLTKHSFAGEPDSRPTYHKGKVLFTTDAGGYSYVRYEEKGAESWAAFIATDVKIGDVIIFPDNLPMINFQSKSMNMTFDKITFATGIKIVFREKKNFESPEDEQVFLAKQTSSYHAEISKLSPNWLTTNDDPKFIKWAKTTIEPASGSTVIDLLNKAYKVGDAVGVAAIFGDYEKVVELNDKYSQSRNNGGADWKYYGAAEDKSKNTAYFVFYDLDSLKISGDSINVWSKTVNVKDIEQIHSDKTRIQLINDKADAKIANGYITPFSKATKSASVEVEGNRVFIEETANSSQAYTVKILYKLDCLTDKYKQLTLIGYPFTTMSESELGGWQYASPESNIAVLLRILCPSK